jgi:hypothetical protein
MAGRGNQIGAEHQAARPVTHPDHLMTRRVPFGQADPYTRSQLLVALQEMQIELLFPGLEILFEEAGPVPGRRFSRPGPAILLQVDLGPGKGGPQPAVGLLGQHATNVVEMQVSGDDIGDVLG